MTEAAIALIVHGWAYLLLVAVICWIVADAIREEQ